MSHRSRLSSIVIDCETDDLTPHLAFWSKALGKPIASNGSSGDGKYA